jgi:xanthine dehydrogenase accessory factor
MTQPGLSDAFDAAIRAQDAGEGLAIATVIRSEIEGVAPGDRMLVRSGTVEGSIQPTLDDVIAAQGRHAVDRGRSTVQSFDLESRTAVGMQGGDLDIFFDVVARPAQLVIVGAGHIAMPLARFGSMLDFRVAVLDDRPEFATRERFPDAAEIVVGRYGDTLAAMDIGRESYVVLVTRGHVHDQACLEVMLQRQAAYVGMIGSRSRVRTVMRHLAEEGYPADDLQSVHAPIGLDLGARTPAEIALSIMAEIVGIRRGGTGSPMALGEKLRV